MRTLVNSDGTIDYGLIREPVDCINFETFDLRTPMGRRRSALARKILFKQFVFAGINAPDFSAGLAVVDLKYAANGFFYVYDRNTGQLMETHKTTLPFAAAIKPCPEAIDAVFNTRALQIRFDGEHLLAKTGDMVLDVVMEKEDASPLRICTKAGYSGWTYTRKTAPIDFSRTTQAAPRAWRRQSEAPE